MRPSLDGLCSSAVLGYVRVSSKEQTEGYSLAHQAERIRDFCTRESLSLMEVHSDPGRSGRSVDGRNGLLGLLDVVEQGGIGAVVVWRDDRLSRRVADARDVTACLHKAGTALICLEPFRMDSVRAQGSGMAAIGADLIRDIQQITAEHELQTMRSRILPGQLAAVRAGIRGGHLPLGYLRATDKTVVVDPVLGPAITEVFRAVARGTRPSTIVKQLAADGLRRGDGALISADQVRYLLANRYYQGEMAYHPWAAARLDPSATAVRMQHHHPALVDAVTFARVQQRLASWARPRRRAHGQDADAPATAGAGADAPQRPAPGPWHEISRSAVDNARRRVRAPRPVHGIVPPRVAVCACCGSRCYCSLQTRGSRGARYRVPIYLCEGHKQHGQDYCPLPPIAAEAVDTEVAEALAAGLRAGRADALRPPSLPPVLTDIDARLQDLRQRQERLRPGLVVNPDLAGRLQDLQAEEEHLLDHRAREAGTQRLPSGPRWQCLENYAATWPGLDMAQRRDVVDWLLERVLITPDGVGAITWRRQDTGDGVAPPQVS